MANQEVVWFDVSMDNTFLVYFLDALDHLHADMQAGLQIKFAFALLEKIFEWFAKKIHNHNVIHFAIFSFLITNEVQVRNHSLATKLVDQFTFPEKHDVFLVLHSLFNFGC